MQNSACKRPPSPWTRAVTLWPHNIQESRAIARRTRDAAVNFDTYQILQRRRMVSLLQHGFLVYISDCSNAEIPERHRQTDERTDDLLWHNCALRSIAR